MCRSIVIDVSYAISCVADMYCKKCGSDKHWDSGCDVLTEAGPNVRRVAQRILKESRTCPTCGTNLDARDKARKRRREYMKRYRKK